MKSDILLLRGSLQLAANETHHIKKRFAASQPAPQPHVHLWFDVSDVIYTCVETLTVTLREDAVLHVPSGFGKQVGDGAAELHHTSCGSDSEPDGAGL